MAVATALEKTPPTNDRLPGINEYVIKRYLVKQVIGDGGYGTVLSGKFLLMIVFFYYCNLYSSR